VPADLAQVPQMSSILPGQTPMVVTCWPARPARNGL